MSKDSRLSKVKILCQQNKFSEAEKILKELLSQAPHNVKYLALFAEVNLKQRKYKVAREVIENAIGLAPDNPELFNVKAQIALCLEEYGEAEINLKRCIELAPGKADYFSFLAYIKLENKEFEEALTLANRALKLDAEHLQGLNTRGTALLKLNRKTEAFDTIQKALRKYPDNAYTHANYGWGLLEKGEPQKAGEHFKEALKIDPYFEFAKAGLRQVIATTNPPYRAVVKYLFFMNSLTVKFQLTVVIAFYLGLMWLHPADKNEVLKPYLNPLTAAALVAALFLIRVIHPITNFFLRFHKYGHLLLTIGQRISANFATGSFVVFITGAVLYIFTKEDKFLPLAFFGFAMMAPLGAVFLLSKQKLMLLMSTAFLFLTGLWGIRISFIYHDIHNIFSMIFLYSFIGFQFLSNYFQIKEKK